MTHQVSGLVVAESPRVRFWAEATRRSVLRRATIVAAIVGPILALINHGDAIVGGALTLSDMTKVCLTFLVPFSVSCVSSVLAASDRTTGPCPEPPLSDHAKSHRSADKE